MFDVYSCILVSTRTQQQFTWQYVGGDPLHSGTTFTCPVGTSLYDDVVIGDTGSHVFHLEKIVKGMIYGFYYVRRCGDETMVPHVRTAGHIRPTDDFIKKHGVRDSSASAYSLRPRKPTPTPPQTKKRKARSNSGAVKKRNKAREKKYQWPKYSKLPGGLKDPRNDTGRHPLSRKEAHLVKDQHQSVMGKEDKVTGEDKYGNRFHLIYMVRGWRHKRSEWYYEGRAFNSSRTEFLTSDWLNKNHMDSTWRTKTFAKYPRYWFRVPVMRKPGEGMCCPLSIIKCYNFFGLTRMASELSRSIIHNTSFIQCCRFIYRHKGFEQHDIDCSTFDPIEFGAFPTLFLLQICAIETSLKCFDNYHAICICSGLIFDANHEHPLPLNKHNLDKCCVGGDSWVYHHVSRGVAFIPGKNLTKFFRLSN